jgi:hypothetical protein
VVGGVVGDVVAVLFGVVRHTTGSSRSRTKATSARSAAAPPQPRSTADPPVGEPERWSASQPLWLAGSPLAEPAQQRIATGSATPATLRGLKFRRR